MLSDVMVWMPRKEGTEFLTASSISALERRPFFFGSELTTIGRMEAASARVTLILFPTTVCQGQAGW